MNKNFVPKDFIVPENLETDKFRLRMLSVDDVEKDYEAVMSSREHLRNPLDENSWPRENMTLEENLQDLRIHQDEFLERAAFAYTVMSIDESKCLGCVYINPSKKELFDAEIYMWARASELKNGLDELLYETVRKWISESWSFNNVAYPGREISWSDWDNIEDELYIKVKNILEREKLAYIATTNNQYVDNSTICFAIDDNLHIYFGSYSDTLKCKNLKVNPLAAISVSTIQIHGIARIIEHRSEEYNKKIKIYNSKFPQYAHVFNKENNELYEIKPLVIWNYNPSKGEMHRDKLILNTDYYNNLNSYEPPKEFKDR